MIDDIRIDTVRTEACCGLDSSCGQYVDGRRPGKSRQNALFFFPCRATCARCWRIALILGSLHENLQLHDTKVLVVVEEQYLAPARRLAQELDLPIRLIATTRESARCLRPAEEDGYNARWGWSLVLVDKHGLVCFLQDSDGTATLRAGELLGVVERTNRPRTSLALAECLAC